ncbi:hypothetical protein V8B97DRAFT_1921262 [Scleroderma yunnanense]
MPVHSLLWLTSIDVSWFALVRSCLHSILENILLAPPTYGEYTQGALVQQATYSLACCPCVSMTITASFLQAYKDTVVPRIDGRDDVLQASSSSRTALLLVDIFTKRSNCRTSHVGASWLQVVGMLGCIYGIPQIYVISHPYIIP